MKLGFCVGWVFLFFVAAWQPATAAVSDTLRKLKVEQPEITTVSDTTAKDSLKKGFFHSFYRYFQTANEDKTLTKKIDFSIIGGPHYSSDIKLGLGLVAAGLFRVDRTDLSIPLYDTQLQSIDFEMFDKHNVDYDKSKVRPIKY